MTYTDAERGLTQQALPPNSPATSQNLQPRYRHKNLDPVATWIVVVLLAILVPIGAGDTWAIHSTLDLVLKKSPTTSWMLTVAFALVAIVVSHLAGVLLREGYDRHKRRGWYVVGSMLMLAWAAAGTALGALRIVSGKATTSGGGDLLGGISSSILAHNPTATALLLGTLWALTGATSCVIGWLLHTPAAAAMNRLRRYQHQVIAGYATQKERTSRAEHSWQAKVNDGPRLDIALQQAEARAEAHTAQLRAHAELELVRILGDPGATSDILPRPDAS